MKEYQQIPKIQESSFKNQDSRIIKIKTQDSRPTETSSSILKIPNSLSPEMWQGHWLSQKAQPSTHNALNEF